MIFICIIPKFETCETSTSENMVYLVMMSKTLVPVITQADRRVNTEHNILKWMYSDNLAVQNEYFSDGVQCFQLK